MMTRVAETKILTTARTVLLVMCFLSMSAVATAEAEIIGRVPTDSAQGQMIPELGVGGYVVLSMADYTGSGSERLNKTRLDVIRGILMIEPKTQIILLNESDAEGSETEIRDHLKANIEEYKGNEDRFDFVSVPPNVFTWVRDYVAEYVSDSLGSKLVKFRYVKDEILGAAAQEGLIKYFTGKNIKVEGRSIDLVGDGGMLMLDGQNRLFITESLKSHNTKDAISGYMRIANDSHSGLYKNIDRKTKLTPKTGEKIEALLKEALGVKEVIWLPVVPNESTGHIDMYAKILKNNNVVVAKTTAAKGNAALDEIHKIFSSYGFNVTRIENAKPGEMAFRSYTNSLIIGDSVILPRYGVKKELQSDRLARETYEKLGYTVFQVDGGSIDDGGSVHCLTKIIPVPN